MISREYTDVLKVLQDAGPSLPYEEIKIALEYDLKRKVEDVFEEFDTKAIAAASLAQVHKAKLKNGDTVAVKVQFPFLRTLVTNDFIMLHYIVEVCNYFLRATKYKEIDLPKLYKTFRSGIAEVNPFPLAALIMLPWTLLRNLISLRKLPIL